MSKIVECVTRKKVRSKTTGSFPITSQQRAPHRANAFFSTKMLEVSYTERVSGPALEPSCRIYSVARFLSGKQGVHPVLPIAVIYKSNRDGPPYPQSLVDHSRRVVDLFKGS